MGCASDFCVCVIEGKRDGRGGGGANEWCVYVLEVEVEVEVVVVGGLRVAGA